MEIIKECANIADFEAYAKQNSATLQKLQKGRWYTWKRVMAVQTDRSEVVIFSAILPLRIYACVIHLFRIFGNIYAKRLQVKEIKFLSLATLSKLEIKRSEIGQKQLSIKTAPLPPPLPLLPAPTVATQLKQFLDEYSHDKTLRPKIMDLLKNLAEQSGSFPQLSLMQKKSLIQAIDPSLFKKGNSPIWKLFNRSSADFQAIIISSFCHNYSNGIAKEWLRLQNVAGEAWQEAILIGNLNVAIWKYNPSKESFAASFVDRLGSQKVISILDYLATTSAISIQEREAITSGCFSHLCVKFFKDLLQLFEPVVLAVRSQAVSSTLLQHPWKNFIQILAPTDNKQRAWLIHLARELQHDPALVKHNPLSFFSIDQIKQLPLHEFKNMKHSKFYEEYLKQLSQIHKSTEETLLARLKSAADPGSLSAIFTEFGLEKEPWKLSRLLGSLSEQNGQIALCKKIDLFNNWLKEEGEKNIKQYPHCAAFLTSYCQHASSVDIPKNFIAEIKKKNRRKALDYMAQHKVIKFFYLAAIWGPSKQELALSLSSLSNEKFFAALFDEKSRKALQAAVKFQNELPSSKLELIEWALCSSSLSASEREAITSFLIDIAEIETKWPFVQRMKKFNFFDASLTIAGCKIQVHSSLLELDPFFQSFSSGQIPEPQMLKAVEHLKWLYGLFTLSDLAKPSVQQLLIEKKRPYASLRSLLNNKKKSDFTFVVENLEIKFHKFILANVPTLSQKDRLLTFLQENNCKKIDTFDYKELIKKRWKLYKIKFSKLKNISKPLLCR